MKTHLSYFVVLKWQRITGIFMNCKLTPLSLSVCWPCLYWAMANYVNSQKAIHASAAKITSLGGRHFCGLHLRLETDTGTFKPVPVRSDAAALLAKSLRFALDFLHIATQLPFGDCRSGVFTLLMFRCSRLLCALRQFPFASCEYSS